MKRFITLLLSLAMVLTLSPAWVMASEQAVANGEATATTEQAAEQTSEKAAQEDASVAEDNEAEVEAAENAAKEAEAAQAEAAAKAEAAAQQEMAANESAQLMEEDKYWYNIEGTYFSSLANLVVCDTEGESTYYEKTTYCYSTNNPAFEDMDAVPTRLTSVKFAEGEPDVVSISEDEVEEDDVNIEAWVIRATKCGSSKLIFTYTVGYGSPNAVEVEYEADVNVSEVAYSLDCDIDLVDSHVNVWEFLPGESIRVKSERNY